MVNVFDIADLRFLIFSYVYPNKIKSGMVLQYGGSKHPKKYMNEYIGKLYVIDKYVCVNLYPYLRVNGIIFTKDVDTEESMMFFPEEDHLKIVLV